MNEKYFELTLSVKKPDNNFIVESYHKIESRDLVHLLTQFQFILIQIYEKEMAELYRRNDDIPF